MLASRSIREHPDTAGKSIPELGFRESCTHRNGSGIRTLCKMLVDMFESEWNFTLPRHRGVYLPLRGFNNYLAQRLIRRIFHEDKVSFTIARDVIAVELCNVGTVSVSCSVRCFTVVNDLGYLTGRRPSNFWNYIVIRLFHDGSLTRPSQH